MSLEWLQNQFKKDWRIWVTLILEPDVAVCRGWWAWPGPCAGVAERVGAVGRVQRAVAAGQGAHERRWHQCQEGAERPHEVCRSSSRAPTTFCAVCWVTRKWTHPPPRGWNERGGACSRPRVASVNSVLPPPPLYPLAPSKSPSLSVHVLLLFASVPRRPPEPFARAGSAAVLCRRRMCFREHAGQALRLLWGRGGG